MLPWGVQGYRDTGDMIRDGGGGQMVIQGKCSRTDQLELYIWETPR